MAQRYFDTYGDRNNVLRDLGFNSYQEYLASDLWKQVRNRILQKHSACVLCGGTASTVHHNSYTKETLIGEDGRSLYPVCGRCHFKVEFDKNGNKVDFQTARKRFGRMYGWSMRTGILKKIGFFRRQ